MSANQRNVYNMNEKNLSNIHHRKTIRLQEYDYSQSGAYFVTICTKDRILFFNNDNIKQIVYDTWLSIPEHHSVVTLDEFVIMPNHIHGIVIIANQKTDTQNDEICRDIARNVRRVYLICCHL